MRKVMTVVGTRPELIKLSLTLQEMDRYFDHVLVHTGQNYDYELNEIFFKDLDIRKPDHFLNCAGNTPIETIASVLVKGDEVLEKEKPEALLLYGDTNSCLIVIAAKKRKIPIFHMEAGNRSFDQRVPEEINRKIVDHLSDFNMPLTEHSRQYLIAEGIPANLIAKTGSCLREILHKYKNQIDNSKVLERLDLKPQEYFVVSAHREENVDVPQKLEALIESLSVLATEYGKKVWFSVHPRTQKRLEALNLHKSHDKIIFSKAVGFHDYIHLQKNAFCVLSDSGTVTEESALLGFPVVTMRDSLERPEGIDAGVLVMASIDKKRLVEAVKMVTTQAQEARVPYNVPDYQVEDVSRTVVRAIAGHIDYINRTIWRKY